MTTIIDGTSGVTYPTGTNQKGSLTLGTAKNTTSGTFVDFTDIPSWAKRITVMFSGLSTNGTSSPIIQMGTVSGIESSGYSGVSAGGAATAFNANVNWATGIIANDGTAATSIRHGNCVLSLIGNNIWTIQLMYGQSDTNRICWGSGSKTLSGTLDRIRITTVNGTDLFDAGSVNIMYE